MNANQILEQKVREFMQAAVVNLFDELFADDYIADNVSNSDLTAAIVKLMGDREEVEAMVIDASC